MWGVGHGRTSVEDTSAWSSQAGLSNPDLSASRLVRANRSLPFGADSRVPFVNPKLLLVTASSANCTAASQRVVEATQNPLLSDILVGRVACTRKSACLLLCPDCCAAAVFS